MPDKNCAYGCWKRVNAGYNPIINPILKVSIDLTGLYLGIMTEKVLSLLVWITKYGIAEAPRSKEAEEVAF